MMSIQVQYTNTSLRAASVALELHTRPFIGLSGLEGDDLSLQNGP